MCYGSRGDNNNRCILPGESVVRKKIVINVHFLWILCNVIFDSTCTINTFQYLNWDVDTRSSLFLSERWWPRVQWAFEFSLAHSPMELKRNGMERACLLDTSSFLLSRCIHFTTNHEAALILHRSISLYLRSLPLHHNFQHFNS